MGQTRGVLQLVVPDLGVGLVFNLVFVPVVVEVLFELLNLLLVDIGKLILFGIFEFPI